MKNIKLSDVEIEDSISPWIYVKGIGKIGMWAFHVKSILLDYSLKFMGLPIEEIPCEKDEIEGKILELFNGKEKQV